MYVYMCQMPPVVEVPFADAVGALKRLASRRVTGKLVLKVQTE